MSDLIKLTVRSIDGRNLSSSMTQNFSPELMGGIIDNQNPLTAVTITEAGDSASQLSAWDISGNYANTIYYWSLTNSSTTRKVSVYSDATKNYKICEGTRTGDGDIYLSEVNSSGIKMQVTVAYSADDVDSSNTLTITNMPPYPGMVGYTTTNSQVYGNTEFWYKESDTVNRKYTVDETVAQVNALAGGADLYYGKMIGVIDITGGKAQGTYNIPYLNGLGNLTLPVNAVVTRSYIRCTTGFTTTTTTGTVAINITTDDAAGILAATLDAGLTAGNHEGIQTGTATNFSEITTDERAITYTIANETMTAGVAAVVIEYFVAA
jgi:hypothetical protein